MKLTALLKKALGAINNKRKLSPEQESELRRVRRRLQKFPRLRGCPNPFAHRTAHFKGRYGLDSASVVELP